MIVGSRHCCDMCGKVMQRVHSATWLFGRRDDLVGYLEWCSEECRDDGQLWLILEKRRRRVDA